MKGSNTGSFAKLVGSICICLIVSLLPVMNAHGYLKIKVGAATGSESEGSGNEMIGYDGTTGEGIKEIEGEMPTEADPTILTGAMTFSVPITVPPGRGGMAPKIALSYNSYRKQNSWLGVGWDLDMGSIQRSTKHGVRYELREFVVMQNGGTQELLRRPTWDTFCGAQGEAYQNETEGSFARYCYDDDRDLWTVTTKDGTRSSFGGTATAKQTAGANTFKWFLTGVVDANSNEMALFYQKDDWQVYLQYIDYTGNSAQGVSPFYRVEFVTETRADIPASFVSQAPVRTTKRLQSINVKLVDGTPVSRYALAYNTSPISNRSRLTSVTQFGSDGVTPIFGTPSSPIPTYKFSWGALDNNGERNTSPTEVKVLNQGFSSDWRSIIQLGDFNGDGLKDFVYARSDGFYVGINTPGAATPFTVSRWYAAPVTLGKTQPFVVADVDGDGYDDIVYDANGPASTSTLHVLRSTGTEFVPGPQASRPHEYVRFANGTSSDYMPFFLADLNGDGFPEIVYFGPISSHNIYVIPNNGGQSFGSVQPWGSAPANWAEVGFGDHNGDGLTDLFFIVLGEVNVHIMRSTGTSFETVMANSVFLPDELASVDYHKIQVADMNGDGLSDLVYFRTNYPSSSYQYAQVTSLKGLLSNGATLQPGAAWPHPHYGYLYYNTTGVEDVTGDDIPDLMTCSNFDKLNVSPWLDVQINTGDTSSGFLSTSSTWLTPWLFGSGLIGEMMIADMNGDGLKDVIVDYYWTTNDGGLPTMQIVLVQTTPGIVPDLITKITTGSGGTYNITYKPYAGEPGAGRFPLVLQTVASIETNDANGTTSVTSFEYFKGRYHIPTRDFRGFEKISKILPNGTTVDTYFHQGYLLKGKAYREVTRDSGNANTVYKEVDRTYAIVNAVDGGPPYSADADQFNTQWPVSSYFPYLQSSLETVYDEHTYQVQTDFEYDVYGNVTKKHSAGDKNVAGDERDDLTTYYYDTQAWLLSRPYQTMTRIGGASTDMSKTTFSYEFRSNRVHAKTFWQNDKPAGAGDPVVIYTYDEFGNLESQIDPNANSPTLFAYETTAHTFLQSTTNPAGHISTLTDYDYRYGKPQTKTDPNGNVTAVAYDCFGRTKTVVGPDDSATIPTASYLYPNFSSSGTGNVATVTSRRISGTADVIVQKTFYDGLRRTVRTGTFGTGAGGNSTPVYVNTVYDVNGRVSQKSLPYFSGNPPMVTSTYDPLGRLLTQVNPDGATTTIAYDGNLTVTTDPVGNRRDERKDAYGRTVQVTEYKDPSPNSMSFITGFGYDVLGNLLTVTDANGRQTSVTYNSLSRRKTMSDPATGMWSYTYDPNGNLTSQTDARGNTIGVYYDALNRPSSKVHCPRGGACSEGVAYDYDDPAKSNSKGKLTTATDRDGSGAVGCETSYDYDKSGHVTTTSVTIQGYADPYIVGRTYDALGNITTITYPDNDGLGETVNYTYWPEGNLHQIQGTSVYATFSNDYTAAGQPCTITFNNGVHTSLTYNGMNNRLNSLTTTSPGSGTIQDLDYNDYFANGNIRGITDNNMPDHTQLFDYDGLSRLTEASSNLYGTLNPDYDGAGNFDTSYDSGYLANRTPQTLSYDIDNRLISAGTTTFAYNYQGLRVKKSSPGQETIYIDNLYEVSGTGATKHIFAGDRRIASRTASQTYYYHPDHLGSLHVVTNSAGGTVQTVTYFPYGEVRSNTATTVDLPYKFTGQEHDPETGLYYYKSRYYDPAAGIFITPDPLYQAAYDPSSYPRLIGFDYVPKDPPLYVLQERETQDTKVDNDKKEDWNSCIGRKPVNIRIHGEPLMTDVDKDSTYLRTGYVVAKYYIAAKLNTYSYVENDPINWMDPYGLWSLTLEFYDLVGGGLVFGKNPGGSWFISWRGGIGYGGGFSFNPSGTSPGWDANNPGLLNVGIGFYGEANVGFGPFYLGASSNAGVNFQNRGMYPYLNPLEFEYGLDRGWGFRAGGAAGLEITAF